MISLNLEEVTALAKEVVAEAGPDHVAPAYIGDLVDPTRGPEAMCRYITPEGVPSCIVGSILVKAGMPTDSFSYVEGEGWFLAEKSLSGLTLSRPASNLLKDLQHAQDRKVPWGPTLEGVLNGLSLEAILQPYQSE